MRRRTLDKFGRQWAAGAFGLGRAGALLEIAAVCALLASCAPTAPAAEPSDSSSDIAEAAAPPAPSAPATTKAAEPAHAGDAYPVPAPPFSEGIFPCSGCHAEMPANLERRELQEEHTAIKLNHGSRERWCFDCHNPGDRDVLRLANGTLVPFTESYRLCGQCHGPEFRDWRVGVHGKRTGEWDGVKKYLLCAHCHNPHAPRFAPLAPLAPPTRPENIR